MSVVSVAGLGVSLEGHQLLDDVAFDIAEGESLAIVGPSGAGKTTLLNVLMGFVPDGAATTGNVRCTDVDMLGASEEQKRSVRGKRIALLPQNAIGSLDPLWRIKHQLREAVRCHVGGDVASADAMSLDMLRQTGIDDPETVMRLRPHEMSGGMCQRVALAMAVLHKPDVILVDEPTSSLDVVSRREVIDLISSVAGMSKSAVIVVTHDSYVADNLAGRMLTLDGGKVIEPPPTHTTAPVVDNGTSEQATSGQAMLSTSALTIEFGKFTAVRGVDFEIARGESVAIVGRSGSGKSTLARSLVGLAGASSGSITIDGRDITRLSNAKMRATRKRVQLVLQDQFASLDPRMSARQIVREALDAHRMRDAEAVDVALQIAGVDGALRDRRPRQMSGGERQRVSIARGLAVRPELLILDEPTSALDPELRDELLASIAAIRHELDIAMIFVTHEIGLVSRVAERVLVMDKGSIVESGRVQDVLTAPQHPATQLLMSAGSSV